MSEELTSLDRAVLNLLSNTPHSARELAQKLPEYHPGAINQSLKTLRNQGYVRRLQGQHVQYVVEDPKR